MSDSMVPLTTGVANTEAGKKIFSVLAEYLSVPIPALKEKSLAKARNRIRKKNVTADAELIAHIKQCSLLPSEKEIVLTRAFTQQWAPEVEFRQQENLRSIAAQAAAIEPSSYTDAEPEPDTIMHILDSCRNVGDSDVQTVWAKLLAEEISNPSSFSKLSVGRLRDFDRQAVQVLIELARFAVTSGNIAVVFLPPRILGRSDVGADLAELGLQFGVLIEAVELGLIATEDALNLIQTGDAKSTEFHFLGEPAVSIDMDSYRIAAYGDQDRGHRVLKFSKTGSELLRLPEVRHCEEYVRSLVASCDFCGVGIRVARGGSIFLSSQQPSSISD